MAETDQAQQIIELEARVQALEGALKMMRKTFISLAIITKEAGLEVGRVYTSVMGMKDALDDVKKRFNFNEEGKASGG